MSSICMTDTMCYRGVLVAASIPAEDGPGEYAEHRATERVVERQAVAGRRGTVRTTGAAAPRAGPRERVT
jgi:hypothetical protein